jgi:hypothetical protein
VNNDKTFSGRVVLLSLVGMSACVMLKLLWAVLF